MTNLEAVQNIEQIKMCVVGVCSEICKYYDSSENCCKYDLETQHNSLEMAIKALEKQIPKKPIECTDLYPPKQYECPNCGYCVGQHKYMKPTHFGDVLADCKVEFKYCGDCGQKIDWSEGEMKNEFQT